MNATLRERDRFAVSTTIPRPMKKPLRYTLYSMGGVAVLIGGLVSYVNLALPNVGPAPDITVEITPDKVERGHYLAWHVMMCMDCHSERDWSLFSGPPTPGTEGVGGDVFDERNGFPGVFLSRNLTPASLKDWSDGEIYRAITMGVKKDGEPIFPVMPWMNYGRMDDEDIHAVIAYLRTLDPVPADHPTGRADFPMSLIMRTLPVRNTPGKRPDPITQPVAYGEYILNAAACGDCHTRFEKGEFTGPFLAGGREFVLPGGILRTPNLTPHETGIGAWTRESFIARFKQYEEGHYVPHQVAPGDFQTIMPWMMYAGMTEQDLGAIYDYLRTVPPVENSVVRFEVAQ
jgi:mono/diheme cytochrome c family protein